MIPGFPLGLTEILVVILIVLILITPWRLPKLARAAGEATREFRKGWEAEAPKAKELIVMIAKELGIETEEKDFQQLIKEIEKRVSKTK